MEHKVEAAAVSAHHFGASDFIPSSVALAVIAWSSFLDESLTMEQRAAKAGNRAAKSGMAGAGANVVFIATNTWWLALIAGVGSRFLITCGGNKRQRYDAMEKAVNALENQRLRA